MTLSRSSRKVLVRKLTARWPAISLVATLLAVIVIASGSSWIVEKPFLGLKKRFEARGH